MRKVLNALVVLASITEVTLSIDKVLYDNGDGFKIIIDSEHEINTKKAKPEAGDRLTISYIGRFEDGKEFDSSFKRNKPF